MEAQSPYREPEQLPEIEASEDKSKKLCPIRAQRQGVFISPGTAMGRGHTAGPPWREHNVPTKNLTWITDTRTFCKANRKTKEGQAADLGPNTQLEGLPIA